MQVVLNSTRNVRTYIDADPGGADVYNELGLRDRCGSRWC